MYAGLELHTEERLKSAEKNLPRFSAATKLYNVSLSQAERPNKSFNFPKDHTQQHTTTDIRAKGVTKNYNTKPSERAHGLIKDIYAERTNFKNVEEQLSRIEHQFVVGKFTRYQLDFLDELLAPPVPPQEDEDDLRQFHHVYIGSHDDKIRLASLRQEHAAEGTFDNLPTRLRAFIGALLQGDHMPHIDAETMITPYKYMKISYESVETWQVEVDRLRITPDWYSKPRYDWVLFRGTTHKYHFGQLQSVFTCVIEGVMYPIALVTVYDFVYAPRSRVDHELGLVRIRRCQDQYAGSQFIHLGTIIRGALVIKDYGLPSAYQYRGTAEEEETYTLFKEVWGITDRRLKAFWRKFHSRDKELPPFDDRLVIDLVDADMFLRLREYFNLDT
ncbi:hypothetical protein K466DRAFT_603210 [Polyporus arcularius HHB13444]|uniref:Uncharacterized protein n=1 Tax=Polyporus arcularius HHB13444 TaxID=1314778 RepID=A0A5C3P054_9APHY|nr:hypothetical protein K466DRAFT_603210 [Polyporus arcularius HHB13444]